MNYKEILKNAALNGLINIKDYNEGIYAYIIYRIVWETKGHYILYAVPTEEEAQQFIKEHGQTVEYYYQKIKIN